MGSEELKEAIRRLAKVPKISVKEGVREAVNVAPGCAFGAVVDQRLKSLEERLAEIKARINGLIFLIVGAVLLEVVMRLMR